LRFQQLKAKCYTVKIINNSFNLVLIQFSVLFKNYNMIKSNNTQILNFIQIEDH